MKSSRIFWASALLLAAIATGKEARKIRPPVTLRSMEAEMLRMKLPPRFNVSLTDSLARAEDPAARETRRARIQDSLDADYRKSKLNRSLRYSGPCAQPFPLTHEKERP